MASKASLFLALICFALCNLSHQKLTPVSVAVSESWYEIVDQPFFFHIDRSECTAKPNNRDPSERTCLCYKTKVSGFPDIGCGTGYAYICSTVKDSSFVLYGNGYLLSLKSMKKSHAPPMFFEPKTSDTEQLVNMISMKIIPANTCGKIQVANLDLQSKAKNAEDYRPRPCAQCNCGDEVSQPDELDID